MMKHIKLSVCDSTQDELKAHLEDKVLISTERQTKGRGRGINQWEHAEGTLAFSFSCAPHPELSWQSLEVAVLLHQFIAKKFNIKLDLKWPNDLFHHNQKCGGILLHHHEGKMLIGIGLNIVAHSDWSGVFYDKRHWSQSMAHDLPHEFVELYLSKSPLPKDQIKSYWLDHCFHLNQSVSLVEGDQICSGEFSGLGAHGEAIIGGKSYYNGSLKLKDL